MKKIIFIALSIASISVGVCQTPVNKGSTPVENLTNPATAIFIANSAGQQYDQ